MSSDLISALASLTAPDREVDALIALDIARIPATKTIGDGIITEQRRVPAIIPSYTASLDAAVALCERVLPGWKKHMWDAGVFGSILPTAAVLEPDFVRKSNSGEPYIKVDGEGPTPAIALLIAILTALEDREK